MQEKVNNLYEALHANSSAKRMENFQFETVFKQKQLNQVNHKNMALKHSTIIIANKSVQTLRTNTYRIITVVSFVISVPRTCN
jgi:hypothetical protein